MPTNDKSCSIVPYFKVHDGKLEAFKAIGERCVEQTRKEPKCQFYGFSFHGDEAFCRESYDDAEGVLAHFKNVTPMLQEAFKIADLTRLEIHGPAGEIDKLREPLGHLKPKFFILESGFRR